MVYEHSRQTSTDAIDLRGVVKSHHSGGTWHPGILPVPVFYGFEDYGKLPNPQATGVKPVG